MKKILFVFLVGAFAACGGESTEATVDTTAATETVAPADTTTPAAPADTTVASKPADTTAAATTK